MRWKKNTWIQLTVSSNIYQSANVIYHNCPSECLLLCLVDCLIKSSSYRHDIQKHVLERVYVFKNIFLHHMFCNTCHQTWLVSRIFWSLCRSLCLMSHCFDALIMSSYPLFWGRHGGLFFQIFAFCILNTQRSIFLYLFNPWHQHDESAKIRMQNISITYHY